MARRSGLGRGLGALIPSEVSSAESGPVTLTELPVSAIATNPNQPRKAFDEETLASLTASVRELKLQSLDDYQTIRFSKSARLRPSARVDAAMPSERDFENAIAARAQVVIDAASAANL